MMRIEEFSQIAQLPVAGQHVLRQIVCTDREKIHLPCQFSGHQHRGRRFNHNADFGIAVIGHALLIQLRHHLLAGPAAFAHLPH